LLVDLLMMDEEAVYETRFDIPLLTRRLATVAQWISESRAASDRGRRWRRARGNGDVVRGKELLAVLFPLFSTLLVWPLLTVANRLVLVAGIPALVLYLFGVWAVIVVVLAWAGRRARREDGP